MPFFSIIIPTYNRAHLIEATLQSVLAQTEGDFECIIVDDGSTDNSRAVIEALGDSRFQYFWKENGERGAARNQGALLAQGQYLNFVDSDDLLYKNHLEVAKAFIQAHQQVEVVHQAYDIRDQEDKLLVRRNHVKGNMNLFQIRNWVMSPTNVFIRSDVFQQFPFSEDRRLSATEDSLLWLKLLARYEILFSEIPTSVLVQHSGRSMETVSGKAFEEKTGLFLQELAEDEMFMQNYPGYFGKIKSRLYGLTALYAALDGQKQASIKNFKLALQAEPAFLFTRRALGIIKHLLLK